jgi:two-component system nitrate/nitrite response regulator NarL
MNAIQILIADDHPMVLRGLGEFLASVPDMKVVAACPDGAQALQAIRDLKPDIAILDLAMPVLTGLDVLAAIQEENLGTKIVFLTALAGTRDIMSAMAEGAYGLLMKDATPEEMLFSLREVAAGRKHLPFELLRHGQDRKSKPIPTRMLLTNREWKVMELAARGLSNKEIARKLNMTEGTAKVHLHHIFQKTGVNNRTALANVALLRVKEDRADH